MQTETTRRSSFGRDATVVGSGPNGLAAAIELARGGLRVTLLEAAATVGGGARTLPLTLPGYRHDVCSAIHPLAAESPFFNSLSLGRHGLRWIIPPAALAHPFDDGTAALLERDVASTSETLDPVDIRAYMQLMVPLLEIWETIAPTLLAPLSLPAHPLFMARFGLYGLRSASSVARGTFRGERARALFAGLAAHSFLPLTKPGTAAFGLILGILGHRTGWPLAAGGSDKIVEALAAELSDLGGKIICNRRVDSIGELPAEAVVFLDLTPRQVLGVAGARLDGSYRRALGSYRYGPGVFKLDLALAGPIPWRARACSRAATVHVGGTMEEIAAGEEEVWQGGHPERPFVLLAQPSLFDASRAPEGKHVVWAYCHVPPGSGVDMGERIERQIERFAPGFRELIIGRHVMTTVDFESYNANCVGGDINGGIQDLRQIIARPVAGPRPYATSDPNIYLCSASTPPGGGVHGLCGYHAARCYLDRRG